MSTLTANYNFIKQKLGHPERDTEIGTNLDMIDAAIKVIDDKQAGVLTLDDGKIMVGDSEGVAGDVEMSGDVEIDNTGKTTIALGTFGSPLAVQNSDWDTEDGAYTITKAMVSGCLNEDLNNSQCVRQLWSRFKITATQTAGSGKDYYGGEMQVRPHTGSAAIELAGGTYAGVLNYWENSDAAHALTVSGGYHYGSINMVELCSAGVISGGTFAAANMTNHVDTDVASATLFDGILINKVAGAQDWKIGVDVNNSVIGVDIGACTTGINFSGACTNAAISMNDATFANLDHEIQMRNSVAGDKTIIASGLAASDADIRTAVGADADIADGSLYLSIAATGGKLFCKQSGTWTDISTA